MPTAFDNLYRRMIKAQDAVTAALRRERRRWLAIDGVSGYGVGGAYPDFTALFALDRTHPAVRAGRAGKRLPKSILVGRTRVPTQIIEVGPPKPATADIGNPTANRRDYRNDGAGTWPMGVALQVFPAAGTPQVGTAGALVEDRAGTDPKPPCVLTVQHLTQAPGNDTAQWQRNRDPAANRLHNFVGTTGRISPDPQVDAGLVIEVSGPETRILDIGPPKPPQRVSPGMHVRKSGAATGLTYGTVIAAMDQMQFPGQGGTPANPAPPAVYKKFIMIRNACPQQPPAPGVLPPGTPADRFAAPGDSGALVVLGLPVSGVFGNQQLDLQMAIGTAAERADILATYDAAAAGLLVLLTDARITAPGGAPRTLDVAWAHEIQLVLDTLQVNLRR